MLGNLAIRADRVGDDTSLSRIIHMVEDTNKTRAPVQNYADHMASMLVPVSFIGALVVYLATRDISRVLNQRNRNQLCCRHRCRSDRLPPL